MEVANVKLKQFGQTLAMLVRREKVQDEEVKKGGGEKTSKYIPLYRELQVGKPRSNYRQQILWSGNFCRDSLKTFNKNSER